MARTINRLSALKVGKLVEPGVYADGGGLNLRVSKDGTKSWSLRYMMNRKAREMGLGSCNTVSLADARRRAQELRDGLKHEGRDPIEARNAKRTEVRAEQEATKRAEVASSKTFGVVVDEFLRQHERDWRNAKHRAQWRSTLSGHAALLWNLPVAEIDTPKIRDCLEPIWSTKTVTAARLRQRIEKVLDAARALKYRDGENPARWRGNLDTIFSKPSKHKRGHHASMPFEQVGPFMRALRDQTPITARAIEFLILTAARSGEVRGATWKEIDLDAARWTIPAERMKAGKEHRVPLVPRAVEILKELAALAPQIDSKPKNDAIVFPSIRTKRALSDMTLLKHLHRMGLKVTAHGFRASFRTWAGEATHTPREVAEACLAHAIGDATEQAYARGDMFERRRVLMQTWADFIEQQPASNVVAFSRPA